MFPYIIALVFLIIIILYEVYDMSEAFQQRDASGNVVRDGSGNDIRISLSDLYGLLGPIRGRDASGNTVRDASGAKVRPAAENTVKAPAAADLHKTSVSIEEITQRLSKNIAKQVKDDLMSYRSTEPVLDRYAPCDITDAEAQGREYAEQKPLPSSQPDMSEYIRKDSIPCWNCAVP